MFIYSFSLSVHLLTDTLDSNSQIKGNLFFFLSVNFLSLKSSTYFSIEFVYVLTHRRALTILVNSLFCCIHYKNLS